MKRWVFLALLFPSLAQSQVPTNIWPVLTIGTNVYTNVRIVRVATNNEVMLRTDTGWVKTTLAEMPPEVRQPLAAQADELAQAEHAVAKASRESQAALTKAFIAKYRPYRVIAGELYDFTEPINYFLRTGSLYPYRSYSLEGRVAQVAPQGLVVIERDQRYFVINSNREESVVDDVKFKALGMVVGRRQYTTVLGATATIPEFDCGITYGPDHPVKFTRMIRITRQGEVYVPIPAESLPALSAKDKILP